MVGSDIHRYFLFDTILNELLMDFIIFEPLMLFSFLLESASLEFSFRLIFVFIIKDRLLKSYLVGKLHLSFCQNESSQSPHCF